MKRVRVFVVVFVALAALLVGAAGAEPPGPVPPVDTSSLASRVAALEAAVAALQSENAAQQITINTLTNSLNEARIRIGTLETWKTSLPDLTKLQTLAALAPYVSVDLTELNQLKGPHVIFQGANVHIRSGSGKTDDNGSLLGLGNLVVGYNDNPYDPNVPRNGSHNIVIGDSHEYISFGGMVVGNWNKILAPFAVVSSGYGNKAVGIASVVSGGEMNEARGNYTVVSGGRQNCPIEYASVVSGGFGNATLGKYSVVSGGYGLVAWNENEHLPQ